MARQQGCATSISPASSPNRARPPSKPNSTGYQHTQLRSVKRYTAFLKKRGELLIDPCENLPVLHSPKPLPKGVLSNAQIMRLLRMCDLGEAFGFRDRAIMETLFSCGLRGCRRGSGGGRWWCC